MSNDKRRSYRLPVQDDCTKATVKSGRDEWPATLINESAGGFLLTAPLDCGVNPGEMVTIDLYSGSYLVEIVHTRIDEEQLQLGARRFDDELQPRPRVAVHRGWARNAMQAPPRPISNLLLFGAYAAITVLASMLILGGRNGQLTQTLLGQEGGSNRAWALSSLPTPVPGAIDWRQIQSLHGINSLTSDQIRKAIALTEDQQRSLDGVFVDTSRRLRELYAQSEKRPAEDLSRASSDVIDEALQRILCTLTDQQINRWRQELILGSTPAAGKDQASAP